MNARFRDELSLLNDISSMSYLHAYLIDLEKIKLDNTLAQARVHKMRLSQLTDAHSQFEASIADLRHNLRRRGFAGIVYTDPNCSLKLTRVKRRFNMRTVANIFDEPLEPTCDSQDVQDVPESPSNSASEIEEEELSH